MWRDGSAIEEVLPDLLRFIGSRPLVGFYLEFDVAMLNRHVRRLLGIGLPNAQIEVSGTYYERKYGDAPPGTEVDLRFMSILEDLGLPALDQHDAYLGRPDDGDDVPEARGPEGPRRPHPAGARQADHVVRRRLSQKKRPRRWRASRHLFP